MQSSALRAQHELPHALIFGSQTFSQNMSNLLASLGYAVSCVNNEGQSTDLLLELVAKAGHSWQLFVYELILQTSDGHNALQVARELRKASQLLFIAVWSASASESAAVRLACFELGANMVTYCQDSLCRVASAVASHGRNRGNFSCVACGMASLTEDELWAHYPMFHVNHRSLAVECQVCKKHVHNFAVHLRNDHGPPGRGEMEAEAKAVPIYSFSLVVCRHPDGRFLLVQEFSNQGFWLPGGAVDPGEALCSAAIRETKEEAGVDIELTGILKIEHSGRHGYVRMRTIFVAQPLDCTQLPKSVPDYESVGAAWATMEEIATLRLRGTEPLQWCSYVAQGGPVHPLSLLDDRGER